LSGHVTSRAIAKIAVQDSDAKPYDQASNPTLIEVSLRGTFTGDMDGTSTVRALQIRYDDGSAKMVSVQRFCGKLGDRQGTFVLPPKGEIRVERLHSTLC